MHVSQYVFIYLFIYSFYIFYFILFYFIYYLFWHQNFFIPFFFIYFLIICPIPGCSGMFRNVPCSRLCWRPSPYTGYKHYLKGKFGKSVIWGDEMPRLVKIYSATVERCRPWVNKFSSCGEQTCDHAIIFFKPRSETNGPWSDTKFKQGSIVWWFPNNKWLHNSAKRQRFNFWPKKWQGLTFITKTNHLYASCQKPSIKNVYFHISAALRLTQMQTVHRMYFQYTKQKSVKPPIQSSLERIKLYCI